MTRLWAGVTVMLLITLTGAPRPAAADVPLVQLQPFIAPIEKANRNDPDSTPITLTFEVPNENDVARVCRMTPRIRDAVNEELFTEPLKIGRDRKLELAGLKQRLLKATNRALGKKLVSGMIIEAGATQMQTGGAKFAGAIACAQINK